MEFGVEMTRRLEHRRPRLEHWGQADPAVDVLHFLFPFLHCRHADAIFITSHGVDVLRWSETGC